MQLKSLLQDPISPPPWCSWIRSPNVSTNRQLLWKKSCSFYGFRGSNYFGSKPGTKKSQRWIAPQCSLVWFRFLSSLSPVNMFQQTNEVSTAANVNFECRSANQAPLWCECDLEYQHQQKREKRRQWAKLIWKSILWCKIISHGHSVYFPVCTVWVIERGLRGRERPHTQKSPTWQYNHLPKLQRGRRVHFKLVNIELDSRLHRKCLSMSKGTDVAASERLEITSKKTKRCQNTFLLGADQSIGKWPVGNKSPCFRLRRGVSEIVAQAAQTFPNFILQFQHFLACLTTVPCESGF